MKHILSLRQRMALSVLNDALLEAAESGLLDTLQIDSNSMGVVLAGVQNWHSQEFENEYHITYSHNGKEDTCVIRATSGSTAVMSFYADFGGQIVKVYNKTLNIEIDA